MDGVFYKIDLTQMDIHYLNCFISSQFWQRLEFGKTPWPVENGFPAKIKKIPNP